MFHVGQFQLPRAPVRPEEFRLPVSHTHTMLGWRFTTVRNLKCRSVELLMKLVLLPLGVTSKKLRLPKTHRLSGYRQLYCNSCRRKRDMCCYYPYQMLWLKKKGRSKEVQRVWVSKYTFCFDLDEQRHQLLFKVKDAYPSKEQILQNTRSVK